MRCSPGGSFSSRHRFIDTGGRVHTVIVLADRMLDDGAPSWEPRATTST